MPGRVVACGLWRRSVGTTAVAVLHREQPVFDGGPLVAAIAPECDGGDATDPSHSTDNTDNRCLRAFPTPPGGFEPPTLGLEVRRSVR